MQIRLRQPLASGSAGLARWARLGGGLPGLASLGLAISSARQDSSFGTILGVVGAVIFLPPALFALFSHADPPSDLWLDDLGLRVEGGPHHGLALPWGDLDPQGLELVETREKRLTVAVVVGHLFLFLLSLIANQPEVPRVEGDPVARLWIRTRSGNRVLLARGVEQDEIESLRGLTEALRSRLASTIRMDDAPPTALCCDSCKAPVRPSEEPVVSCAFCHHPVTMPEALRQRLTAHRTLAVTRHKVQALVARLVNLPSARRASLVSKGVFATVVLLSAVLGAAVVLLALGDAVDAFALGALVFAVGLLVAAAFKFGVRLVMDRRALGTLGAWFGARAPRREGDAWGCRGCGAPLPEAQGALVRCTYCDMESVTGIDARLALAPLQQQHAALEEHVENHARRRASADRSLVFVSLGAIISILILVVLAGFGYEVLSDRRACAAGNAEKCYVVALSHYNGTIRADRSLALDYAERGCSLGSIEACCMVRDAVTFKWGAPKDLAAAQSRIQAAQSRDGKSPCPE